VSNPQAELGPVVMSRGALIAQTTRARDELTIALQRLRAGPHCDQVAAAKAVDRARAILGLGL
jgi:hypothetical protein